MKHLLISILLLIVMSQQAWSINSVDSLATTRVDTTRMVTVQVPDTLVPKLRELLNGRADIVPRLYLSDKVIVGADTVPEIIKTRNWGRYDRGLFNYLFIPKGQWQFGLTASYGEFSSSDLQILDLLKDFDFSGHTFSIRPYISYFIGNNMSIGLRLGYTDSKGTLSSLSLDFDDDLNIDVKDAMYRNEAYTAAIMFRQYVGLMRRGRFGVFNEVELSFSSGDSDFQRSIGGTPRVTHTTYTESRLSFSPGLSVFIMRNVSFNISFGVVGFYLRNEKQTENGVSTGSRFSSGANFRFNIFNINFGVGVHL